MLKNYFLVALRNFSRSKVFSIINLAGLTLGIAFCLVILLWVEDEKQIDSFHANSSRIYNIYEREFADGKVEIDYSTPGLLSEELKKRLPEVEYAASYTSNRERTFEAGENVFKQSGRYSNEDFLKVFNYPLLEGNVSAALSSPSSIAVSEKMATLFFGSARQAIGKMIRCNNEDDLTITAVFKNVGDNSSVSFDYLINWHLYVKQNPWIKDFGNTAPSTTVLVKKGTSPEGFRAKIKDFMDQYEVGEGPGYRIELDLQRYDEMYLHSTYKNGQIIGGRIEYVRLFSIVAVFILLIACINFMNLTTARSLKRAKEIGVRKVVGAVRGALIRQFIGEALLLSFVALLAAIVVVYILLPVFNNITGKQMALPVADTLFWLKLLSIALVTGVIAGVYPAFYVSAFHPIAVLKGKLKFGPRAAMFRKGLVVFQFTLSILLIAGTIAVSRQVNFIQTKNLGFDRQNLIYLPMEGDLTKRYTTFKQEAVKMPGIQSITRMNAPPTDIDIYTTGVDWDGKDPTARPVFAQVSVGYDFIKTLDAQMLHGRDFSKDYATDKVGFLINEEAAKRIGYKEPVNSNLKFWDRQGKIIGVVKNFHFRSLHEPIKPIIIRLEEQEQWGKILVRTQAGKTKEALSSLERKWKQFNPKIPFTYQFSNEEFQKLYKSEGIVERLSKGFAALAILISCLGLFGLVIFTAEQRTKEIGIRKVLGASVASLFTLLSKEFLKLVVLAIVIATPTAWWAINSWLEGFEYKISIGWWFFAVAGLIAIFIAMLTVSFKAARAAIANPVRSLRSE